jgi:hypothetical protein
MWLLLRFTVGDNEQPDVHRGGHLRLSVIGQLKLSAVGRQLTPVRSRWVDRTRTDTLDVAGFGRLPVKARGWATHEQVVTGNG